MEMKIEIFEDPEGPREPLFKGLRDQEKKLAEEEGREPEGWFWTEGMEQPRAIDFSDEGA